jgi:hypothetical protein
VIIAFMANTPFWILNGWNPSLQYLVKDLLKVASITTLSMQIKRWLKLFAADTRQAIVGYIVVGLVLAGGGVHFLTKTTIKTVLQIANTPTPLWATISLTLLCCLYVYLKTRSYSPRTHKIKLSKPAKDILIFFGQQHETQFMTTHLSHKFNLTINQTQFALDELHSHDFLYAENSYELGRRRYWLSPVGREYLGKNNLMNKHRYEITVQHNGKEYSGHYHVEGKVIVVSARWSSKKTQIGSSPPATLAGMLLHDLIRDGAFEDP